MIAIEPTHFRLTVGNTALDLTAQDAEELCAVLIAILPSPHEGDCTGCSEEVPAVTPADFRTSPPTLQGVIIPPDPALPTTGEELPK